MQYNTMQYNAIQCNTMQYNAIQCNAIQYTTQHLLKSLNSTHSLAANEVKDASFGNKTILSKFAIPYHTIPYHTIPYKLSPKTIYINNIYPRRNRKRGYMARRDCGAWHTAPICPAWSRWDRMRACLKLAADWISRNELKRRNII